MIIKFLTIYWPSSVKPNGKLVKQTSGSKIKGRNVPGIWINNNKIVPSFLREFSAPVILKTDLDKKEYLHILKFDNDPFNKWDAIQNLYLECYYDEKNIPLITSNLCELLSKKNINFYLISFLFHLVQFHQFFLHHYFLLKLEPQHKHF